MNGQKKLVHDMMKVKRASIAAAGRAAGTAMCKKVWNRLAPSIRAASTSSSGSDCAMYWVIQNTPNAVTRPGTMTAPRVPVQPNFDMAMNSGTTLSCVGTHMVPMTKTSSPLRPRNLHFANAKPASVEKKTTDAAMTLETTRLLARALQKLTLSLSITERALATKLPPGIHDMLVSLSVPASPLPMRNDQ